MKKTEIKKTVFQVVKFGLVGASNTAVDFAVFNFLTWITQTYSGASIAFYNIIAFSVAVVNSYVWNKFWTFKNNEKQVGAQFVKFFVVSVVGGLLNSGVVFILATYVDPPLGLNEVVWANVAKLIATALVLIWNFVGYKLWAFKESL